MGECALRMVSDEEVPGVEEAGNGQPADRAAAGCGEADVARRDPADPLRALHVVAAVVSPLSMSSYTMVMLTTGRI